MAAALLAAMGRSNDRLQNSVVSALTYTDQEDMPWAGGALFVPGLQWGESAAVGLTDNFMAWIVFCDRSGLEAEKQQLVNNFRSLALLHPAGLNGLRVTTDTAALLRDWGARRGVVEVSNLLEKQGLLKEPRYVAILTALAAP